MTGVQTCALPISREQFERIDEAYKAGGFAAMAAALDAVEFFDPENPPPIAGPPLRDIRELRCIWIVHYNLWARRHAAKNPSDDRRGKVRGRRKSRTRG